eukprot:g8415.t1
MEEAGGITYDPAGLASKYGHGSDSGGSTDSNDTVDTLSQSTQAQDLAVSSRVADLTPGADRTARITGGTSSALQELQSRNATLLEAVEEKSRQVQELGTLVECLEPVPGLDPASFYSVLRGAEGSGNDKDLDYRDHKIVHLARRTRALNARLEGEKARSRKARREADVLATELEACRRQLELVSSAGARLAAEKGEKMVPVSSSIAQVGRISGKKEGDRLRQQVVLLRTRLQEAQDEVKTCRRALSKEVGGASNRALIDESGWKGRAQQIILLKTRVKQLEAQLRNERQDCRRNDVDSQEQERIMEHQRGRAIELLEGKVNALHEEGQALRSQVLAKGARIAGLEKANGRIRDRAKLLQEKSDSDDRLVDALRNEIQTLRKMERSSR